MSGGHLPVTWLFRRKASPTREVRKRKHCEYPALTVRHIGICPLWGFYAAMFLDFLRCFVSIFIIHAKLKSFSIHKMQTDGKISF